MVIVKCNCGYTMDIDANVYMEDGGIFIDNSEIQCPACGTEITIGATFSVYACQTNDETKDVEVEYYD